MDVIEANNFLQNTMIEKLASDIDLELIKPYTINRLIDQMHIYGINVRFIGVLAMNIKI